MARFSAVCFSSSHKLFDFLICFCLEFLVSVFLWFAFLGISGLEHPRTLVSGVSG